MKIYLLGFMGSGKSFIGKRLAKKLDMDFIDLDHYIEQMEGLTISQLFENKSEKGFRQIEKKYLQSLSPKENTIIACGGGTPCFYNNMKWMNENGLTIYLKSSNRLLFHRLKQGKSKRPLLKNLSDNGLKEFIKMKMEERASQYEEAEIVVYRRMGDEGYLEKLTLLSKKFFN